MSINEIEKALVAIIEKAKSPAVAKALEVEAVKSIRRNFEQEGRPKWDPSKKKRRDTGLKTLTDSGNMSKIQAQTNQTNGGVEIVLLPGPASAAYARIQHEGGTINMPARQLRFRKDKSGNTRFAKNTHKRVTKETMSKPYSVTIPARPYLIIPEEDYPGILEAVKSAIIINPK